MCQKQIKLNAKEDVQEFVRAAGKCDFDIDVFYNRIIIDAKSILGILSMDLTKVLTVTCHGEDHEFNRDRREAQREIKRKENKKRKQT